MQRYSEGKRTILSHPAIAIILGLVVGSIAFLLLTIFSKIISSKKPALVLAAGLVGFMCSGIFCAGALLLFRNYAKSSFVWFGIPMVVAYMVWLGVYAVQNMVFLSDLNRK